MSNQGVTAKMFQDFGFKDEQDRENFISKFNFDYDYEEGISDEKIVITDKTEFIPNKKNNESCPTGTKY